MDHVNIDEAVYTVVSAPREPFEKISSEALPIYNGSFAIIDIKTINDVLYGYTGWYIHGISEYIFMVTPSFSLASWYIEKGRSFTPFTIDKGELLIPLGIEIPKEMWNQFHIVPMNRMCIKD
jgi:hypothetical protein